MPVRSSAAAFQIIHAFLTKEWYGFVVSLSCGVLYLIGGLLIMNEPVQGALALTILVLGTLIAVELVVQGVSSLYFGLALRTADQAWGRS